MSPQTSFLGEARELRVVPSAAMLQESERNPALKSKLAAGLAGPFLGVGDPIYNSADPRDHAPWLQRLHLESATNASLGLARLPGSAHELEACARQWAPQGVMLLSGKLANKEQVLAALKQNPSVIHFATHVVDGSTRYRAGRIALSLQNATQLPEFLTVDDIIPHYIPARLVVLSGCGSARASALPGVGLMGLTRAWLGSGASAVLATQWSTPDDGGEFLVSFYGHLKTDPGHDPSVALRAAVRDMLDEGGFRAKPSYWATYFLMGN